MLQESIAKGEDNVLLQTTITLAEVAPKLLRPQLDTIMQLSIKVSVTCMPRLDPSAQTIINSDDSDKFRQLIDKECVRQSEKEMLEFMD